MRKMLQRPMNTLGYVLTVRAIVLFIFFNTEIMIFSCLNTATLRLVNPSAMPSECMSLLFFFIICLSLKSTWDFTLQNGFVTNCFNQHLLPLGTQHRETVGLHSNFTAN